MVITPEPHVKLDALKGIASYTYIPRILVYLAGLAIAIAVLKINNSRFLDSPWLMSFLFIVCLTWPHIAQLWVNRSKQVQKVIINSLLFDSLFGGFWLPFMSFELVPSAVFVTVLMINNISAGGLKLFVQGMTLMLVAALLTSLWITPTIKLESEFIIILFCIPMLVLYPLVFAAVNYKLIRLMILQREKLLHISRIDGLTGLFTRRYWEKRLLEEFNRCQRSGENACVMMIDIDHFKSINDNYGHLVGDNVLKKFGHLLLSLRSSDIAGRYGGEEFAVLLPNSSLEESLLVAERLRQKIEITSFDNISYCTVSIGIASLGKNYEDAYKWLDNADQALYQAKANGRNQVKTWAGVEIEVKDETEDNSKSRMTIDHNYI